MSPPHWQPHHRFHLTLSLYMSSSPSKTLATAVAVVGSTTLLVVLVGSYRRWWWSPNKKRRHPPPQTVDDLKGNFHATGSDVVRIYRDVVLSRQPHSKIVLITGTTSGLGEQTARLFGGLQGVTVIVGNRSSSSSNEQLLEHEIKNAGGGSIKAKALHLDLASLESVKRFAEQVRDYLQCRTLDILIHNAGIYAVKGISNDDYPLVWQVNALAPAFLTELLLSFSCLSHDSRILMISSEMHRFCWTRSIAHHCPPSPSNSTSSTFDYALAKACQILYALALQDRGYHYAIAIEPGLVPTKIGRYKNPRTLWWEHFLFQWLLRTIDQGCSTTMMCALAPWSDLQATTATTPGPYYYYYADCQPKRPSWNCTSVEEARALQDVYRKAYAKFL